MIGTGRELGSEAIQEATVLLESVKPTEWKTEANNYLDGKRGAYHQVDVRVTSPHSELHLRAYEGNGYYNEFPGPYYEAVLNGARLSEDQAREIYGVAESIVKAASETKDQSMKELLARAPQALEGATWNVTERGNFQTTIEGI